VATIRVIHLDRLDSARMHKFGNLAEDIWRSFRENPRGEADLAAVDKGSDTLVVKVRTRLKGRMLQSIRQIVKQHMMEFDVRIEAD
jgi:hypothetical protein